MTVATTTLATGQTVKLGRIPPSVAFNYGPFRIRDYPNGNRTVTLRLEAYHDTTQVTATLPDSTNRREKALESLRRMYVNDRLGDCVIASKYHSVGLWTGNDSDAVAVGTDQEVVTQYHRICGPGDNGCNIGDVMDAFRRDGLPFSGVVHKIDDFISVDWTNKLMVQTAIYLFGSGPLGINLPAAWEGGSDGGVWDVNNSGIVGGHDVPMIDYDARGVWISTWGGTRLITWAAFTSKRWIDECDIALAPDWYGNDQIAPNGINAAKLRDDLAMMKSGQIPPIDVPPPPVLDWTP